MKWIILAIVALTVAFSDEIFASEVDVNEEVECLAQNMYWESRNQSFRGLLAVGNVVMNRVADSRFPNTVCEVVHQSVMIKSWKTGEYIPKRNRCQFSWYCDGRQDEPARGDAWESAKLVANEIYEHYAFRGLTEGATHYHATYVNPTWINDRGMHMVGRVGEHIFYRWNNGKGS